MSRLRWKEIADEPAPDGEQRWMVSYADFLTLLFAAFVVAYFASTARGIPRSHAAPAVPARVATPKVTYELPSPAPTARKVATWVARESLEDQVTVNESDEGATLALQTHLLFRLGEAELTEPGQALLARLAPLLQELPYHIRVEGHTDDLPIHSSEYPSNWHLSSARAATVVLWLIKEHHIPPHKLSAVGYGEHHPAALNRNEAERQENRRVEFHVTSQPYR